MRITFKDLSYYNYLAIAGYGIEAFCLEEENSPHLHFYLDPLYKFLVRRGKKFLKIKASHMKEGDILYGNKKFEILRIDGDPLVEPPFTLRFVLQLLPFNLTHLFYQFPLYNYIHPFLEF